MFMLHQSQQNFCVSLFLMPLSFSTYVFTTSWSTKLGNSIMDILLLINQKDFSCFFLCEGVLFKFHYILVHIFVLSRSCPSLSALLISQGPIFQLSDDVH